MKILHNPHCSKSCGVLEVLQQCGEPVEIIEYLDNKPGRAELIELLALLQIRPLELIRKNEPIFLEKYKNTVCSDDQWIDIMLEHPILIERPIIIHQGKAVIGRPLERVYDLLKN